VTNAIAPKMEDIISFQLIVIIFIYCNWVVTRWQWASLISPHLSQHKQESYDSQNSRDSN